MEAFKKLTFPARTFLLSPWLLKSGLYMIDAQPGHGKTLLAMSIGYAVASKKGFLDWKANDEQDTGVLYVEGELPGEDVIKRLSQLGDDLDEKLFRAVSLAQFDQLNQTMPSLGTPEGRKWLDKEIEDSKSGLIILDSLATLGMLSFSDTKSTNNDIESWSDIQAWALRHRARGRSIIFLHHQGKSGSQLGTIAHEIALDARMAMLCEEHTEEDTVFKISFIKPRHFYGTDTLPFIARAKTEPSTGHIQWTREPTGAVRRDAKHEQMQRVKDLLEQGMSQTDIAKELGLGRSRVSQIVQELRKQDKQEQDNLERDDETAE